MNRKRQNEMHEDAEQSQSRLNHKQLPTANGDEKEFIPLRECAVLQTGGNSVSQNDTRNQNGKEMDEHAESRLDRIERAYLHLRVPGNHQERFSTNDSHFRHVLTIDNRVADNGVSNAQNLNERSSSTNDQQGTHE